MKTLMTTLLIGVAALLATRAIAADPACFQQAHNAFLACGTECKTDFVDAKAACRNIEAGCLSQCNADRDDCIAAAMAPLNACIAHDGCSTIVDNGRTTCRAQVGCGAPGNPCGFNPAFVQCLDPYEQLAFGCRDNCRNLWQLNGGPGAVNACRLQHESCVHTCPPAN